MRGGANSDLPAQMATNRTGCSGVIRRGPDGRSGTVALPARLVRQMTKIATFPTAARDRFFQGERDAAGHVQRSRQGFRQQGDGLVRTRPRNSLRRVPRPAGPFGLRQVDGSPTSDRARGADAGRDRLELRAARIRLRVSGADADALVGRVLQRLAAAPSGGRVRRRRRGRASRKRWPRSGCPASPRPIRVNCRAG